jgi:hypothetical protein
LPAAEDADVAWDVKDEESAGNAGKTEKRCCRLDEEDEDEGRRNESTAKKLSLSERES